MRIQNPESRIQNCRPRRRVPQAVSSFCILHSAFSLLEVMVATAIFFTATFGILQLVSLTLRNARALQINEPSAAMLAAELAMTNSLAEDRDSGNFKDSYPGYSWTRDVYQVSSNGMFEADFTIHRRVGRGDAQTHMSILLFRPMSPEGVIRGTLQ